MTQNPSKKIENIDKYLQLVEDLEEIISNEDVLEGLSMCEDSLRDIRQCYSKITDLNNQKICNHSKWNLFVSKNAKLYHNGDFEKAENELIKLRKPKVKDCFKWAGKSFESFIYSASTFVFSREISKIHYDTAKLQIKALKSILKTRESNKMSGKFKKQSFDSLRKLEFMSAKLSQYLIGEGYNEKLADYIATEQIEIIYFGLLDSVANKYGKNIF